MQVDNVEAHAINKGTVLVVVSPKGIDYNETGEITSNLQKKF